MIRKDIAEAICKKHGITFDKANAILDDVFRFMIENMMQGEKFFIRRFGTLSIHVSRRQSAFDFSKNRSYMVKNVKRGIFKLSSIARGKNEKE